MAALREAFHGRRGRLLTGLLLAEFAAAVQSIAYSSVLPLAARDLHGSSLYGATLAAGTLTTILVLAAGFTITGARRALFVATCLYVVGVLLAATAPAMWLVLLGSIVRGTAGGLLAGFTLSAIGGLFDSELRKRVLGLYALIWLLPALIGPPVNGALAASVGWRWAIAWPALLVIGARVLVGRDAAIVPWQPSQRRIAPGAGIAVVAGIAIASAAPASHAWWGLGVLGAGVLIAAASSVRVLRALLGEQARLLVGLLVFLGLTLAYFGGDGVIALSVVTGLGHGALAGSLAVGAGLVGWSVLGLRQPGRPALIAPVLAVLAAGLAAVAGSQAMTPAVGLAVVVVGWTVGGAAMGTAYGYLYGAPFDDLAEEHVTAVATAATFAELAGTALGGLLGGGTYSALSAAGVAARPAIAAACALLAGCALASAVLQFGGASRSRSRGTSSEIAG